MTSGTGIDDMCSKVNSYLPELSRFFSARSLALAPTKSTATLFTNWTKEYRLSLNIHVDGLQIPTVNNPKILGVTFDSLHSFTPHTTAIVTKVQSRNKILKSLAGSTWGKDKETLLATYKAIGRPVVNYAAPVWSPGCSDTQQKKLQACQNTALRTATGCLLMSPMTHLNSEAIMLPIKEHNELLTKQFLLGCFRRNHPCSHLLEAEPPPRCIKRSLLQYVDELNPYTDQTADANSFRHALNAIHSGAINTFIDSLPVNGVLKTKPPPIADEELELPRETRVTLAQLRSGYCSRLNSYLSRLNPDIQNTCPACNESPHDSNHLFVCPMNPTHLTPLSLWSNPVETARFLGLPLDDLDDN
ncbi:uncharacterized protein LOC128922244 [Zeugodacus cucurbitae]|uniref:uncharacterized protein LOC128922244 n=1 Tax=Zeugodacus cucurbitae TaxID=28588 RepID=UPI0023D9226A|nr:uncharacterized protein LOC128922244 [Zeugodacus cucurbitae]